MFVKEMLAEFYRNVPVSRWSLHEARSDGFMFVHRQAPISVIMSVAIEDDDKPWLHISMAHRKRMPTVDEFRQMKDDFIGPNRYAYQIFPPEDRYVNQHPYCLHLWHCLAGDPLPEFSGLVNGARTL